MGSLGEVPRVGVDGVRLRLGLGLGAGVALVLVLGRGSLVVPTLAFAFALALALSVAFLALLIPLRSGRARSGAHSAWRWLSEQRWNLHSRPFWQLPRM
eukprot:14391991-Alexandrium_andersonii.AAC.1